MQRINEEIALVNSTRGTANSTPLTSAWVDVKDLHEILAVLHTFDMANETIDFKVEQATDGSGTGVADLRVATQLAASAAANDDKQVLIDVTLDKLTTGYRFVRMRAVTGAATGGAVCMDLWARPRVKPASHNATVVQTTVL